MDAPQKAFSEVVNIIKSWIPWRTQSEAANVSRDFWMPDKSCMVCYECDSQFTLFNRRHHCRHCGRVFCAKCTANSVPAPSSIQRNKLVERDRIRVCNYCYKHWDQGITSCDSRIQVPNLDHSYSLSTSSLTSTVTANSSNTLYSMPFSVGSYQQMHHASSLSLHQSSVKGKGIDREGLPALKRSNDLVVDLGDPLPKQYKYSMNRIDDYGDEYGMYLSDSELSHYPKLSGYYSQAEFDGINNIEGSQMHTNGESINTKDLCNSSEHQCFDMQGEWGYVRSPSSLGSGEQKMATKSAVDGHFRALVAQLLEVENLPVEDNDDNSWLEIITSLSWEAATLLKPDTSQGGGMDPGGYVKVKCIACGKRNESVVVKGVVCKKNVAHRRMRSKIEKPRLLILGGALEYQRVTNLLSSVDTLLHQEMDHLKMAVTRLTSQRPDVLLVEKSVSRYAQEDLLAKGVSLILNVKRPLLERIARCTGTPIVPSTDHLSSQKLGHCDIFHVEKFVEDLNSAGRGGKKTTKTLMYFEGCPKPLGFTILLRGADKDELKKVKHVVQYGVFAAYHLALETSFLADEGATLPEFPLHAPITVTLPDKVSSIERSISTVPGFLIPGNEKSQGPETGTGLQRAKSSSIVDLASYISCKETDLFYGPYQSMQPGSSLSHSNPFYCSSSSVNTMSDMYNKLLPHNSKERNEMNSQESRVPETSIMKNSSAILDSNPCTNDCGTSDKLDQGILVDPPQNNYSEMSKNLSSSELSNLEVSQNHSKEAVIVNGEPVPQKEEFPPSPSDHQSILVSLSSRCVWKGTVCERSHLFRIKYYGSFDKPLGRFLRDHLFDQGTLTISVKKLPEILLPGEKDGKIWMWHRCLRCPRINGFPPATQRIIMSDAAWGLSFGKFLELSFSNHAAASRVAGCGHSLHRDCLRFYGFGKMVACFRYASIDVHSVYLPPHKLEFDYGNQEWIQKESDEVVERAELLFSEVLKALSRIGDKKASTMPANSGLKTPESRSQIAELEGTLRKEKLDFEEALHKILNHDKRKGQPEVDILEINRLRRQLVFQSYMWDHRLIYAATSVISSNQSGLSSSISEDKKRPVDEKLTSAVSMPGGFSEAILMDSKPNKSPQLGGTGGEGGLNRKNSHADVLYQEIDMAKDTKGEKEDEYDPLEPGLGIRRALSDGLYPSMPSLSDTLDAKWTGEKGSGFVMPNDHNTVTSDAFMTDSLNSTIQKEASNPGNHAEDQNGPKGTYPASKGHDNMEDSLSWLGMPFLNFYRSFNKNFLASTQKFVKLVDYNPVYVSSFREMELQGGARLLLPIGVNDIVIPVIDDEPSSLISYALMSPEYHVQLTDEGEKTKDGVDTMSSLYFGDSGNFQSFLSTDDTTLDYQKSFGLTDELLSSLATSRTSWMLDPLVYSKALHARVSFGDAGPLGKVKYSVTCYYAKRFEALRKVCCPSELDYIRSLSRCKKWGAQGGKSNVFFAKSLDDRFIIKQVTKTELESFIKFGPEYFKYLNESIASRSPTCLAKILGIYQVTKTLKGGKETRIDVLVMENLLFRRIVTRLYDLKGSSRSRYNPDSSGSNKVLLDQNLIEAMPTSPIFVGNKAKRLLERAVWNDTAFLASVGVMDYSLLVGVDEEKHELVIGIIDFMRQYTWDKHLETWVKASGILGGPKNTSPTVISPKQYKKRFRKAMTTYFLMLPDQWSPPSIVLSKSQNDLCEENNTQSTSVE
ncbi:1-phosphatidylinositol-3-phosphate 5-kinase FAB1B [Senna tora]|uniref:1-phosphatidylinositol-3-phosphate 5-kinase n=1 Tax=Senna tora TaxID=362788 RepID=A0A834XFU1_9FABA|nr:1-phosphatidylinositol-3-phosphate 5-kinase FAB1B [Senna tora]